MQTADDDNSNGGPSWSANKIIESIDGAIEVVVVDPVAIHCEGECRLVQVQSLLRLLSYAIGSLSDTPGLGSFWATKLGELRDVTNIAEERLSGAISLVCAGGDETFRRAA